MLYTFGGKAPQVDPTAFVSASAELIGDVIVGPRCYIGPYAVIRADASRIVLEEEVAVEDGVIIHTGGEDPVVTISRRVTIGHGAIVHARVIGPEASIGMGAVLSLCSEIGAGSIVAESALVPQGKIIPPETLVAGVPARPLRDIEIIDLELIMADIEMVQRRIDKAAKAGKSGDKACLHEADVFRGLLEHLNDGKSARTYDCSDEDRALLETSDLLSIKPVIYAANLDENTFAAGYEDCRYYQQVRDLAASQGAQVLPICAKVEQEIGELEPDERAMFLEELGIEESGLDRLIQCSYSLLGLISFLTCGSDECRAWTITRGTKAPQAAGKIHSDFERGFIRAEIVAFDDLKACGSMAVAKEKGLVRSEGKDYVMHDGDVTLFRFNV